MPSGNDFEFQAYGERGNKIMNENIAPYNSIFLTISNSSFLDQFLSIDEFQRYKYERRGNNPPVSTISLACKRKSYSDSNEKYRKQIMSSPFFKKKKYY